MSNLDKTKTRLIIQGSVPVEDITEGEIFYKMLKDMFFEYDKNSTLIGQIFKQLEPCCDHEKELKPNGQTTEITQ